MTAVTRGDDGHLVGADHAARRDHGADFALLDLHAGDFTILDDVRAQGVSRARVAPGHGIMPHRAAAPLQQPALNRKPRASVAIQDGDEFLHFIA